MPVSALYDRLSQSRLAVLAQGENEMACEELLSRLRPLMTKLINAVDPQRAVSREDLFSAATVATLESLKRFDPNRGVQFSTFAYRRIEGAVIDLCRKVGPDRPEAPFDDEGMVKAELKLLKNDASYGCEIDEVDRDLGREAARRGVRRFERQLPERQRAAVDAVYYRNMTHAAAAAEEGVSREAITKAIRGALRAGRTELAEAA